MTRERRGRGSRRTARVGLRQGRLRGPPGVTGDAHGPMLADGIVGSNRTGPA